MGVMPETTVTFSRLLREPNEVVPLLESGDVLVTRRDGPDIWLSLHEHHTAETSGAALITDLAWAILESHQGPLADAVYARVPWVHFLPDRERDEFLREVLSVGRACASVGEFARVATVVEAWKETAAAYASGTSPAFDVDDALPESDPTSVVANPRMH